MFYKMPRNWCKAGLTPTHWDELPEIEKQKYYCANFPECERVLETQPYIGTGKHAQWGVYPYNNLNYCSEDCRELAMKAEHEKNLELLAIDQGWVEDPEKTVTIDESTPLPKKRGRKPKTRKA